MRERERECGAVVGANRFTGGNSAGDAVSQGVKP